LQRQTQALDLAQNLADLSVARGVTFEQIASELGLDLTRFGADLGVQADAVDDLIRTLQVESLTGVDYFDGVQRIVDAINGIGESVKPDSLIPDETDPSGRGGKALRGEIPVEPIDREGPVAELVLENRLLRQDVTRLLDRLGSSAAATVNAQQETNRLLRDVAGSGEARPGRTERISLARVKDRR
jgi:hypothetical protein